MPTILFFHPDLPYGARRNDCGRCQVNSHCLRTAASATTTEADSGYNSCGITVGAVIATARAFRLADYTADRDFHPALKICDYKLT